MKILAWSVIGLFLLLQAILCVTKWFPKTEPYLGLLGGATFILMVILMLLAGTIAMHKSL